MTARVCVCGHLAVVHVPHGAEHTGRCTGPCDCPAFLAIEARPLVVAMLAGAPDRLRDDLRPDTLAAVEARARPAVDPAAVRARWNVPHECSAEALYDINALCDALEQARAQVDEEYTARMDLAERHRAATALLRAVEPRVRHDHAYPMEIGDHHCPGCDVETAIRAALGGQ